MAKDPREYGYEGDMAISQLKSIISNAEALMSMMKPETDLPEWVQLKITLAQDYVLTARDYMSSEMSEAVTIEKPPFEGPYTKSKAASPTRSRLKSITKKARETLAKSGAKKF
jgi:hypothetical protein